jgi:hypothetical protein
MNGDSRIVALDKPSSGTLRPHPLSVPTAPVAPSRRCRRQQFGTSASPRPICFASAALVTLRSSGGTGELSMIQAVGGLCRLRLRPTPAPAASDGDRASPSRSPAQPSKPRSAAARPLRGRLPSAPPLSSAPSTRPSRRHRNAGASRFSLLLQVLPVSTMCGVQRKHARPRFHDAIIVDCCRMNIFDLTLTVKSLCLEAALS